jgi:hypothetical protein
MLSVRRMTSSVIDNWFRSDDRILSDTWMAILDSVEDELGVGPRPKPPNHPIFRRNMTSAQELYTYLLPSDSVKRIRSTSDLRAELDELVDEVITHLQPGLIDPIEPANRVAIYQHIVSRFNGNVDFAKLETDSVEWPDEPEFEPPDGPVNVTIESVNENNYRDIEIYSVDSAPEFFESTWAHYAYMFYRLRNSEIEPEATVSNIALNWNANTIDLADVHSVPDFPIATVDEDHRGRWTLSKVKNPKSALGDAYGNTEAMVDILSQNEDASEHVWSGKIHQRVATGIRW